MKRLFIVLLMTMIVSTGRTYATTSIESSKKTERQERLINFTMHVFPKEAKIKIGKHKFQTNDGILNVQLPMGEYKYTVSAKGYKTVKNMLWLGAHADAYYKSLQGSRNGGFFHHFRVRAYGDTLYTHVDEKKHKTWEMYTKTPWFISLDRKKDKGKKHTISLKSEYNLGVFRVDDKYNNYNRIPSTFELSNKWHEFQVNHPLARKEFFIFANITNDTIINIDVPDSLKVLKRKVKIAYEPKDDIKVSSYGYSGINPHIVQLGATPITHEYYPGTYRLNYEIDGTFYDKDITIDEVLPSNKDSVITILLDKKDKSNIAIGSFDVKGYDETEGEVLKAKEVITGESIYDVVDEMPQFPGGDAALFEYLSKNIKYPAVAEENGVQGRVICKFVVDQDGSIRNVKVVHSVDPSLDKEAVRVTKSMPKWKPGKLNGKAVRVIYTIPVIFRLQ